MRKAYIVLCAASIVAILAGCASNPIAVSPVGPEPTSSATVIPKGLLQVFSDTETHMVGDNSAYYPHTSYSIHDENGRMVQFVPNHTGVMDESPATVFIPAGHYKVVAESSNFGRVTVPVVIAQGKKTVVHLDGYWKPSATSSTRDLVFLPNGEAVGWK